MTIIPQPSGYQSATKHPDAQKQFITKYLTKTLMLVFIELETAYHIYCDHAGFQPQFDDWLQKLTPRVAFFEKIEPV